MKHRRSIQTQFTLAGLSRFFQLAVLLVVLVHPPVLLGVPNQITDEDLASLERGEILLESIQTDQTGVAMRVTALLQTTADEVWQILGYCQYELIYVKGLKVCEVLEGDQFQMKVHHRIRNSWYTPTLDFVIEATRDAEGIGRAVLVSGDLNVLDGRWELIRHENGSSVITIHEIRIQPKIPVPKWLVRHTLNNDLPDMMACIRGLANASGTERDITFDLKRCPGEISSATK